MNGPDDHQLRPLAVALAAPDASWEGLLESEGFSWHVPDPACERCDAEVIVAPARMRRRVRDAVCRRLERGGTVIAEPGCDLGRTENQEARSLPYQAETFAGLAAEQDAPRAEMRAEQCRGGTVLTLPMRLGDVWCASGTSNNYVLVDPAEKTTVFHHQIRVSKRNVRRIVVETIEQAFARRSLPVMRTGYWPAGRQTALCLRGDLDGGPEQNVRQFLDTVRPLGGAVTLSVYGREYRNRAELLRAAADQGVELANHTWAHYVFKSLRHNRRNVELADELLRSVGCQPAGLVAPAHFWHASLYRAARQLGYRYASSFGYDHDNLPHRPVIAGRRVELVEIPYHCLGDLLVKYDIDLGGKTARRFFRGLIDKKRRAGEPLTLYGHPDMPGRLGSEPDLLRMICEHARAGGDVWCCRMSEFADWWLRRGRLKWRAGFDPQTGRIVVDAGEIPPGAEPLAWDIRLPDGRRHVAPVARPGPVELDLGDATACIALVRPGPAEVGEVVFAAEHRSLRRRVARMRTNIRRYRRKRRELYAAK